MKPPRTEAEILAAIADRTIRESAYLDVKREFGAGDSARREMAKDLASFGIDGGYLLVGVGEHKNDSEEPFFSAPVDLAGLVERIEQVAANKVDPPLDVRPQEIASAGDPSRGYVLVEVPPSPQAPHMVEGVYYARGERTTRRLTDAEVARMHSLRADQLGGVDRALQEVQENDRLRGRASSTRAHLYVVAQPLTPPADMAGRLVWDETSKLRTHVLAPVEHALPRGVSVDPLPMGEPVPSSQGQVFSARQQWGGTQVPENSTYELVFRQDGGVRAFCARLSDQFSDTWGEGAAFAILDIVALAYALRIVRWASEISRLTGYRGSWGFGLLGVDLRGLRSAQAYLSPQSMGPVRLQADFGPYDADEFRETLVASGQQLEETPNQVGLRLVRRLLRALGTDSIHQRLFE